MLHRTYTLVLSFFLEIESESSPRLGLAFLQSIYRPLGKRPTKKETIQTSQRNMSLSKASQQDPVEVPEKIASEVKLQLRRLRTALTSPRGYPQNGDSADEMKTLIRVAYAKVNVAWKAAAIDHARLACERRVIEDNFGYFSLRYNFLAPFSRLKCSRDGDARALMPF